MNAPRDDSVYLSHIRDSCLRIESYLSGVGEKEFLETELIQDAVVRQIQVIGEAVKRISKELRNASPGIPWSDIAGMRDKLVHDYMGIDLEAVWETARTDIPTLRAQLEELAPRDERSHGP